MVSTVGCRPPVDLAMVYAYLISPLFHVRKPVHMKKHTCYTERIFVHGEMCFITTSLCCWCLKLRKMVD